MSDETECEFCRYEGHEPTKPIDVGPPSRVMDLCSLCETNVATGVLSGVTCRGSEREAFRQANYNAHWVADRALEEFEIAEAAEALMIYVRSEEFNADRTGDYEHALLEACIQRFAPTYYDEHNARAE